MSLIENLFLQILNMSMMAGYCVLAVLALRWLFRKAPKRYTFLLWLIVAFRLICPLSVSSAVSIFNLNLMPGRIFAGQSVTNPGPGQGGLGSDGQPVMSQNPGSDGLGSDGQPVMSQNPGEGGQPDGEKMDQQPGSMNGDGTGLSGQPGNVGGFVPGAGGAGSQGQSSGINTNVGGGTDGNGAEANMPAPDSSASVRWSFVCSWIWTGGMAALSMAMLFGWIRLKRQVRTAVRLKNGVYEADGIRSAFVLGVVRPKIYLPAGLTEAEQGWILLHENCHKWRKDYLVKLFASILTVIYWFHPLIWVAWICFCRDMEMSCDEMALEGASREMRKAYSRTLLSVASERHIGWQLPPAFGENSVRSRIRHILSFRKPAVWMGAAFAAALIVTMAVFGTNGRAKDTLRPGDGGAVGEEETKPQGDGIVGAGETKPQGHGTGAGEGETAGADGQPVSFADIYPLDYRDMVYLNENVEVDFPAGVEMMTGNSHGIYLYGYQEPYPGYPESFTTRDLVIKRCNPDGSEMKTIYTYPEAVLYGWEVNREKGEKIWGITAAPDGNLLLTMKYWVADDIRCALVKLDSSGNELWRADLEGTSESAGAPACAGDKILLAYEDSILVYGSDGTMESRISCDRGMPDTWKKIYVTKSGQIFVRYAKRTDPPDQGIAPVDLETKTVGEEIDIPWMGYGWNIISGYQSGFDYDFIMWNEAYVVGWNVGDDFCKVILSFLDSDIDASEMRSLTPLGNETFCAFSFYEKNRIRLLSKADPAEAGEKQALILGCVYWEDIEEFIREFNRTSDRYHVTVWDYSLYGNEEENRLTEDVEAGRGPDILRFGAYTSDQLDIAFTREKLLEDLYPWFNQDSELQQERFLTNIIDAYAVDGGLYRMPLSFQVKTWAAKTSVVGQRNGWTLEEMRELQERYPDSAMFSGEITRAVILESILQYGNFADEVNGIYRFDSPEFIELLEWAAEFPAERVDSYESQQYAEEKVLLKNMWFSRFDEFRSTLRVFGGPVNCIGFPGGEGNGALIDDGWALFGMTAKSECKEGAWQFIRFFLTGEYQYRVGQGGVASGEFPVNLSALEKLAEKALSPEYYLSQWYYIGDEAFYQEPLTKEQLDECIAYLKIPDHVDFSSWSTREMVKEEAEAFFNGERTAAETAKAIQARAEAMWAER